MTMDDLLRETVHGMADEARTATDLATGAMVRGRRIRHRRRAALAMAAVALVGVTTLPYLALRDAVPQPASSANTAGWSTDRPFPLPGGWVVAAVGRGNGQPRSTPPSPADHLVLNRDIGRYQAVAEVRDIWPAPRGSMVAVAADNDGHDGQVGVLDLASGQTRWFDHGYATDPQWSPDGRRLLLVVEMGFAVIDVTTGRMSSYTIDTSTYRCTDHCLFTWQPDGRHVGLPVDDPTAPAPAEGALDVPARRGVQLFAADTGQATRLLPVRGNPISTAAWSPDGTRVLIGENRSDEYHLVDVRSGKVLRTFRADSSSLYFVDDDRLLELGPRNARLLAVDTGRLLQQAALPAELHVRRVSAAPR